MDRLVSVVEFANGRLLFVVKPVVIRFYQWPQLPLALRQFA
jgi:hypothetical protein